MVCSTDEAASVSAASKSRCDDSGMASRASSRSAGWLPTEPSAEKTIFSTFILASASFCSQCRFSSAPRS